MLPYVPSQRRRQLLAGVTALFHRTPPKSPTKLACLHFMWAVFAHPGLYLTPDASSEAVVQESEAAAWLQVLRPLSAGCCLIYFVIRRIAAVLS